MVQINDLIALRMCSFLFYSFSYTDILNFELILVGDIDFNSLQPKYKTHNLIINHCTKMDQCKLRFFQWLIDQKKWYLYTVQHKTLTSY